MDNIVPSLFGITPEQLGQQRSQEAYAKSLQMAQMDSGQRGAAGLMQAGAAFRPAVNNMFGIADPEMEKVKQQQELNSQLDLSSPEKMRQSAEMLRQKGFLKEAFGLSQLADKRESEMMQNQVHQAQIGEYQARALKESRPVDARTPEIKAAQDYADTFGMKGSQEWKDAFQTYMERKFKENKVPNSIDEYEYARKQGFKGTFQDWVKTKAQAIHVSTGGGGTVKPKGLTREAGLKWELDNGMIDQAMYDSAIAASPGGKVLTARTEALDSAKSSFDAVKRNIAMLYDPDKKALKPSANPLFGKWDQYRPDLLQSQSTIDAASALSSLTDQVMMANLADAKSRVGQSFGSMQVQEWDKFTQQLASLKRGMSPELAASALKYVNDFIDKKKNVLEKALEAVSDKKPIVSSEETWVRDANGKLVRGK